jgi:hypothetical protein
MIIQRQLQNVKMPDAPGNMVKQDKLEKRYNLIILFLLKGGICRRRTF